MSKINKVKSQMSKINKVNFDGAYLRSSSGHFFPYSTTAPKMLRRRSVASQGFRIYRRYPKLRQDMGEI